MPGFVNINNAEIYGFEVESAYDADYVFANASYSYVVGKNKDNDTYLTTVAPHELAFTVGGKVPDYFIRFGWTARFVAGPQDQGKGFLWSSTPAERNLDALLGILRRPQHLPDLAAGGRPVRRMGGRARRR